jgi:hypothetical protein
MAKKLSDAEQVEQYMAALEHPMKAEIEALRGIIRGASPLLSERIKWNAPSYFYRDDIVTFGPPARKTDEILLVFHHPSVVDIASGMLEGNYKDRRLATFKSMAEVEAGREELVGILGQIVARIEAGK